MIEVRVKKSDSGDIIGFHMSGHAGYAEYGSGHCLCRSFRHLP